MKYILAATFMTLALFASGCGGGDSSTPAVVPPTTPAGPTALQVTDTVVGTGVAAANGNTVTVHYTGWLFDVTAANSRGTQFDSSKGKAAFSFKLGAGQVIKGWDQGVEGMKVGGSRTLVIPSSLAYGSSGVSGVIPPNTALVFSVELLTVQ
nr:FKBP-type peptidyl-prolyl cis-trans isomerase [Rhodoferax sp.]